MKTIVFLDDCVLDESVRIRLTNKNIKEERIILAERNYRDFSAVADYFIQFANELNTRMKLAEENNFDGLIIHTDLLESCIESVKYLDKEIDLKQIKLWLSKAYSVAKGCGIKRPDLYVGWINVSDKEDDTQYHSIGIINEITKYVCRDVVECNTGSDNRIIEIEWKTISDSSTLATSEREIVSEFFD